MQRRFCEEGQRLDADYFEKTRIWISAEADKRVAVGTRQGVGADEWKRIARRVDEAKIDHERSLRAYMGHVIDCAVCSARVHSPQEQAVHHFR